MFKNTASQKLTVIAFADAGHATLDAGEVVTGDAANITAKIEQDDDGTRTAIADTNPTETEDGQYVFDLTAAECNGDKLTFYPESSTAGVQVVALPSNVIYTRPPNFPDLGIESDGDLTKVNTLDGHTAQTGDSFARLGAPAGASVSADLATVDANVDAIVADTNELQTDWTDGGRLDLILDARASQSSVDTIDGIVDSILVDTAEIGAAGAGLTAVPWNSSWDAEVESEANDALIALHLDHLLAVDYDPASKPGTSTALLNELIESDGGVSRFTANALEQAPSGGGGGDATSANQTTIINHLTDIKGAGWTSTDTLEEIRNDTNELQGDWANGGRLDLILDARASQASVDTIDGIVDAILVDTGTTLPATLGTPAGADMAADIAAVKAETALIVADTNELQADWADGGRLDLILDARSSHSVADVLTTQMTESYNADGVAPTLAQALFVTMQAVTEFANSGTTKTVKRLDGTTTAFTETYDDGTNPTSVTRAT